MAATLPVPIGCGRPAEGPEAGATATTAAVLVTPVRFEVAAGDSIRLVAEALDARGRLLPGFRIEWSADPDSVATVDRSGLVAALREGEVTVTAAAGGRSAAVAGRVRGPRP